LKDNEKPKKIRLEDSLFMKKPDAEEQKPIHLIKFPKTIILNRFPTFSAENGAKLQIWNYRN